jgi:iron complex outermembrane receptor protein
MPRHPAPQRPIVPLLCLLAAAWSAHAGAQDAGAAGSPAPSPAAAWPPAQASAGLDDVVVSATRSVQRSFDAPAAIQAVGQEAIGEAGPRVELSESLSRIPGIVALSRQNWAQDTQLSIRGFGARASFGIRGVRLLVDGIPATMPDGQGQVSAIDLAAAERIEVLRGPLAQLYGNAAGGVLQVFSREGGAPPEAGASVGAGSFGLRRHGLSGGAAAGSGTGAVDASWLSTDGYRAHSAAERRLLGARLVGTTERGTRVTLVANAFDQPLALDPGGLTRSQLEADPRAASPASVAQDARKTVSQRQTGIVAEHRIDAERSLTARVYGGERELFQALALPLSAQLPPASSGGIVALDRRYGGLGLQYAHERALGASRLRGTVGIEAERLDERRRGYLNEGGVQGALRRDEDNSVTSTDAYAQLAWTTGPWTLLAGARSSRIVFETVDAYLRPGNPDDSGRRRYDATNPVAGVTWHASDALNVYVNAGRGFETPTGAELAYRSGASGPNLALEPARSTHLEAGAKWRASPTQRVDLALFRADTEDEIVVDTNVGGRSTFRNAGRSTRRGVELAWRARPAPGWHAQLAATVLRANFVDGLGSGADAVAPGNRVPGVPGRRLFAELAWQPDPARGPHAGLELLHTGSIAVDDRNTDATSSATVAGLRVGWRLPVGAWRLAAIARVDNLADTRVVGSVIVNEAQRRFFEPAPGRAWFLGASATRSF